MTFPTITIPNPASVGKWLDDELSDAYHDAAYNALGWSCLHWDGARHHHGRGETPEALLADIRRQLAENDPLAKLRKEWIAAGRPDLNAGQDAAASSGRPSEIDG